MTELEWYLHDRRMVEHYENEANTALFVMLFMWSLCAVFIIAAVLMAIYTIPYWWVAVIPGGVCLASGLVSLISYLFAKETVEWIKWRM